MFTAIVLAMLMVALATAAELWIESPNRTHYGLLVGVVAAVACLVFTWFMYQVALWQTIHWLDYGLILFFNAILIGVIFSPLLLSDTGENGAGSVTGFVLVLLIIVVFAMSNAFFVAPRCCGDEAGTNRLAQLISIQQNTGDHHEIDIDNMIQVTEPMAIAKANKAMPGGSSGIGSIFEVNKAQIQLVNDHYWYIVDLKVRNWSGFKKQGAVIPGYFRVDAQDPNADAEFMDGFQMKYVPGIRGWGHGGLRNLYGLASVLSGSDLKLRIHRDVLLPNGWRADDLESLEVDDQWQPFYTAALTKPAVGNTGYIVDAFLIFNPQTGEEQIKDVVSTRNSDGSWSYDTSAIPLWVNRVFSLETIRQYIDWWANYFFHEEKFPTSTDSGRFKIDAYKMVATETGPTFQFSLTSIGRDTALSYVIYVDPRTGTANFYETVGELASPTLESIQQVMLEKVQSVGGNVKYTIDETQFQWMLGKLVVYAIVTTTDTQSYSGVTLVTTTNADNKDRVIYAPTLEEAYLQLARQIASDGGSTQGFDQSSTQIQVQGTVDRLAAYVENGKTRYQFNLISADVANTIQFVVDANQSTALLQSGDNIILVALVTIDPTKVNEVFSLTNLTMPSPVAPAETPPAE